MAKTYAPQLIRLLRHIRAYIVKHRPALNSALSSSQQSALDSILAAVGAFDGANITELP